MDGGLARGMALQKDLTGGIEIDVVLDNLAKSMTRSGDGGLGRGARPARDIRDRDLQYVQRDHDVHGGSSGRHLTGADSWLMTRPSGTASL